MTKPARAAKPAYRCTECGADALRWVGRCPECQAWGSVTEIGASTRRAVAPSGRHPCGTADRRALARRGARPPDRRRRARPGARRRARARVRSCCSPASPASASRRCCSTSRTATQPAAAARSIVTGEESTAQVRLRAERIGAVDPNLFLAAENDLGALLTHLDDVTPGLLVVDSVQTISTDAIDGAAGGVPQIRAVAAALIARREGARHRDRARRPRHEGRRDRRPARARAPRRRRAALRGRPALVVAARSRHQEPARRRPTRSAASRCARTAWPGSPTRPGCSCPIARPRCPAPA